MDNFEWLLKYLAENKVVVTVDSACVDGVKLSVSMEWGTYSVRSANLEDAIAPIRRFVSSRKAEEIALSNAGWKADLKSELWFKEIECPFRNGTAAMCLRRSVEFMDGSPAVRWSIVVNEMGELVEQDCRSTLHGICESLKELMCSEEGTLHGKMFDMCSELKGMD